VQVSNRKVNCGGHHQIHQLHDQAAAMLMKIIQRSLGQSLERLTASLRVD
jgi:hypothetical protein